MSGRSSLTLAVVVLLAGCQGTDRSIDDPPKLFHMTGVRITSTEGTSFDYGVTASGADGDKNEATLTGITLRGVYRARGEEHPLEMTVPNGVFRTDRLEGSVSGGLTVVSGDGYRITTPSATIAGPRIASDELVTVHSSSLDMELHGITVDTRSWAFQSHGAVRGEIVTKAAALPKVR
jgi:hypothetical protein